MFSAGREYVCVCVCVLRAAHLEGEEALVLVQDLRGAALVGSGLLDVALEQHLVGTWMTRFQTASRVVMFCVSVNHDFGEKFSYLR